MLDDQQVRRARRAQYAALQHSCGLQSFPDQIVFDVARVLQVSGFSALGKAASPPQATACDVQRAPIDATVIHGPSSFGAQPSSMNIYEMGGKIAGKATATADKLPQIIGRDGGFFLSTELEMPSRLTGKLWLLVPADPMETETEEMQSLAWKVEVRAPQRDRQRLARRVVAHNRHQNSRPKYRACLNVSVGTLAPHAGSLDMKRIALLNL